MNSPPIDSTKSARIVETANFFNMLYGKISEHHFSYLIQFKDYTKIYAFDVSDKTKLEAMARKAVELSDRGVDIWHSVNPVNIEPTAGKRGDENSVSYQTAVVADIDIRSDAHKGDPLKLAANFDEAKSFLPFTPSLIINSGYGLHAYYIFDTPIKISDDNREELKRRNNLLLDVIRQHANGKKIDGVGDLPRILRTPGTFNYKLGRENAPLCHIVENSGLRFSPDELDEKLNALITVTPLPTMQSNTARKNDIDYFDDNPDLKEFRIRRMLDYINVVDGEYEKWLGVGFALFNEGMNCSVWEQWSRTQPEFKEGECERKWNGFHHDPNGISIASLYQWATEGGYDETDVRREYYQLNPSGQKPRRHESSEGTIDSLKAELRENAKSLADFDAEKNTALERLKTVKSFDSDTVFSDDIMTAAAFARIFDKKAFSNFKGEITLSNRKTKEKKVSVNDWIADVKDKAADIETRYAELIALKTEIQARINSLSFVSEHNLLKGLTFPEGYSISLKGGVEKVKGENIITVCRRPVIISEKYFDTVEKKYKVILSYMTTKGTWKSLPATSAAVVANKNKLVDLAEYGFPVTSSNASALVDYFDAFNAENENDFKMTYTVPRCGWYHFDGKDCFVDPRRECFTTDDDKYISIKVDSQSQFASSLQQAGSLDQWKKAYKLAKKSPVARFTVATSVAPPLLKILGERNFLLYINAPTRAGKTTALYLGASAVGSEKMIRSFDATKNGLAGAAVDVNDYPFLIDEKQVADSRIKEQLDNLVYALANGIGRTKLNKDSSLKKIHDWRTIPIMTGETHLLADNVIGGANTRLLSISAPKVILDSKTCREIRNTIKENYGFAFPIVVNKIVEIGKEKLRNVYNQLVDTFAEKYPEVLDEYHRYMAVITLADTLLNFALFGNTTTNNAGSTIKAIDDAIQNAEKIFALIPTTAETSDTEREKAFVIGVMAQNQNRFIGGNVELDHMQMISGKLNDPDGHHYITVFALKEACKKEGFDYRKLVADLVEIGFFVPSDKVKRNYKKPLAFVQKKIGKVNTNCYRISISAFEEGA